MLPILSQAQDDTHRYRAAYRECVAYAAMASVFMLLPLIVAGEQVATLLYGAKYAGTGPVVALLGAASAVRFMRFTPAIAAMAKADTVNQLYANLWRAISLPLAVAAVMTMGGSAVVIAGCALVAETAAALFSVNRLRRRQRIPIRDSLAAGLFIAVFLSVGLAAVFSGSNQWSAWAAFVACGFLLLAALLTSLLVFPNTWTVLGRATGWTWRGRLEPIVPQ